MYVARLPISNLEMKRERKRNFIKTRFPLKQFKPAVAVFQLNLKHYLASIVVFPFSSRTHFP